MSVMANLRDRLVTPSELADYLGVAPATVYELIRRGMPWVKVPRSRRFRLPEVDAWFDEQTAERAWLDERVAEKKRERAAEIHEFVERTRKASGVPYYIEDQATLHRIARLLLSVDLGEERQA